MNNATAILERVKADEPIFPAGCYYDIGSKEYLLPRPSGGWLKLNESQFRRQLKALGYRSDRDRSELVSPLDAALNAVQLEAGVDYSGPLAGYKAGAYTMQGRLVLVLSSPVLIEPREGASPTIRLFLDGLLDFQNHPEQVATLYGWLKIYLEALYAGTPRTGQVLMMAGPKDCGKSLWQSFLTLLMGGRSAKPFQFAMGQTAFNADLFGAEHLIVEDESASTDMRVRRAFGHFIKGVAANEHQRMHAKNRDALMLTPHQRLSISVNDDPEHLTVLPPLDESLMDKILLFKCVPPPRPLNDGTPAGRKAYFDKLVSEAPAFIYSLLHYHEIEPRLRCSRFGVKAYVNPDVADMLLDMSDEMRLLNLIDMASDLYWDAGEWFGTSEELERKLREDSTVSREADRLFKWSRACGTYLQRLAAKLPERVVYAGKIGNRHQYRVKTP